MCRKFVLNKNNLYVLELELIITNANLKIWKPTNLQVSMGWSPRFGSSLWHVHHCHLSTRTLLDTCHQESPSPCTSAAGSCPGPHWANVLTLGSASCPTMNDTLDTKNWNSLYRRTKWNWHLWIICPGN